MLDLENNCTATLGLYQSSDSVSIDGPTDSLDDIAKFFRTALPMQLQNASALEICDYWSVIQMTDFQYAAQSAWYDCSSAAPVSFNITASNFTVFNFTQDCQATVSYWDQYLDPSSFWYGYSWSNDLANLLQASLPSQYTNISYWALYDFASNVVNNGNLSALITEAANICQPEYCRMLGFTGNADIAGIGVSCN
jgi:hypothetical protein